MLNSAFALQLIVNRPNDINLNAAVCEKPTSVHFVDGGNPGVRGIWEFMPDDFKQHW
jgi:hypothetical protein